ncbi:DUF2141 domain-containing protein [Pyxidicoccus parkwayensis]|uniref:DUF2141 domain-containing protein n=1 Tax=Pyxidicoccus parkwayensis TaxID=2813578 RepID=A0ABX7P0G4_9BACT|nr:DUF2141 domain-containing protein [Pyxidicoccus parkwaysis]QSQ23164.1 DUF2141 domain-containing protein [Pyxidicoccus parkwaysis]
MNLKLLLPALLLGASADAATLTLNLEGLQEAKGHVYISVAADADAFDGKGRPTAVQRVEVTGPKLTVTFPDLAPGTYAVSLFHDANGNGKLDTNFIGIPKEGYGFSNNVGERGKPKFSEAKFTLAAEGTTLDIVVF